MNWEGRTSPRQFPYWTVVNPIPTKLRGRATTEAGQYGTKFGEERVDHCRPKFNAIWERHGAVACKRNRVDIFCRFSTMHERDK